MAMSAALPGELLDCPVCNRSLQVERMMIFSCECPNATAYCSDCTMSMIEQKSGMPFKFLPRRNIKCSVCDSLISGIAPLCPSNTHMTTNLRILRAYDSLGGGWPLRVLVKVMFLLSFSEMLAIVTFPSFVYGWRWLCAIMGITSFFYLFAVLQLGSFITIFLFFRRITYDVEFEEVILSTLHNLNVPMQFAPSLNDIQALFQSEHWYTLVCICFEWLAFTTGLLYYIGEKLDLIAGGAGGDSRSTTLMVWQYITKGSNAVSILMIVAIMGYITMKEILLMTRICQAS